MADAAERAYTAIREGIRSGGFPIGSRLVERELCEKIGVSRTPVREALRRLSAEGLVSVRPNHGVHVAEWAEEDRNEIFALGAILQSYSARLAAQKITDVEIDALRELVDRMESLIERSGDNSEIADLDSRFHSAILDAAGNRRLAAVINQVISLPVLLRSFQTYESADMQRSIRHHREIIASLVARDADWAEAVTRSHILAARDSLSR